MNTREAGRQIVTSLVQRFQANRAGYRRPASRDNDTQLRNDFLNDLLLALRWEVHNHANTPQRLQEELRCREAVAAQEPQDAKQRARQQAQVERQAACSPANSTTPSQNGRAHLEAAPFHFGRRI